MRIHRFFVILAVLGLGMGAQLLVVCLGAPTHHCEEGVVWSAQIERGDRATFGRVDL